MVAVYIVLILVIGALVALPFERVAMKRYLATRKITKLCKNKNIKFKIINRAYPFSRNKRNEFDLILRVGTTVIPIKFFSAYDKGATLILDRTGKFCIGKSYSEVLTKTPKRKSRTIKSYGKLPSMKIGKKIIGDKFKCYPVYLNEPPFKKVLRLDENGNVSDFYDGPSQILGCNFIDSDTLPSLLSMYTSTEN